MESDWKATVITSMRNDEANTVQNPRMCGQRSLSSMFTIKKQENNKDWRACGETRNFLHCLWHFE